MPISGNSWRITPAASRPSVVLVGASVYDRAAVAHRRSR
jgi:hypothetical protein